MLPLMEMPRDVQWLILAEVASERDDVGRLRATNKHLSHVLKMRAWTTGLYLRHTVLLMHFVTLELFRSDYFDGDTLRSLNKKIVDLENSMTVEKLRRVRFRGDARLETQDMALPMAVERGKKRLANELRAHEMGLW